MIKRKSTLDDRIMSIHALCVLLREISLKPKDYLGNEVLLRALTTQGNLAAFKDTSRGVVSMSLNHQKDLATRILGSYAALDSLRSTALREARKAAGLQSGKTKRGSKADLVMRLKIAETAAELIRCDLVLLQRAYDLRCTQAIAYATLAGPGVVEKCKREQREIDASFSLMRVSTSNKVRDIDSARRDRDARDPQ
jgi:hypothetical protein